MKELIIATRNAHKVREIKELMRDLDIAITCLLDYGDMPDIIENGDTFAANAMIKARLIGQHTGCLVMGEDSGIEVDALGGRPGIYSARYAGEGCSDEDNNDKLLLELQGVPFEQRSARYRSAMALCDGIEELGVVDGTCEGIIATERRGTNGFGYDPLFVPKEQPQAIALTNGKTFGELDPSIKAVLSHRAKALVKFRQMLADYLVSSY